MNSRELLKNGTLALAGIGVGGCAPLAPNRTRARGRAERRVNLAPVHASWDRVLQIGLRPHRDSGFVLRADRLDDKTLIHNYGHGGAGMSIAWGTGAIAADFALARADRRGAVVGCGSAGLVNLGTGLLFKHSDFVAVPRTILSDIRPPAHENPFSWRHRW